MDPVNNFASAIKWQNEAREILSVLKAFIIIFESPSKIALVIPTFKENSSAPTTVIASISATE